MALRNGLLVHGPTHWAAAVRTKDGEVKVASGRKPTLGGAFDGDPGRPRGGPAGRGVRRDPADEARAARGQAADAGRAHGRGDGGRGGRRTGDPPERVATLGTRDGRGAHQPGARVARPAPGRARLVARRRAQGDRGVRAGRRTADADKEHDRCGSNLVAPMLAATAAGSVAVTEGGLRGPAAEGAVALGRARWRSRCSGGRSGTPTRRRRRCGGRATRSSAWSGTREPTEEQIEVGRRLWPRSSAVETDPE